MAEVVGELPKFKTPAVRVRRHLSVFEKVQAQTVNPFISLNKPLDTYAKIKYGIVGLTLFPVRVILLTGSLTCLLTIANITVLGLPRKALEKPLTGWRKACKSCLKPFVRLALFSLGFWWIKQKGKPATGKEAPIIVSNHPGMIEPLFLVGVTGACPVSKKENADIPALGALLLAIQTILVDRKDPNSRKATADEIRNRAVSDGAWPQTVLFPEGTCSNSTAVINFKLGAFAPGAPVQPVAVRYPHAHFDPAFTVGTSMGGILLSLMLQFANFMEVEFLPVAIPTEAERRDPKIFAERVRHLIAGKLGVGVTEHSFEDVMMSMKAFGMRMNDQSAQVEFHKLRDTLGLTTANLEEHMKKFHEADTGNTGELTVTQFAKAFGQSSPSEMLQRSFDLIDVDEKGTLNFFEFVVGLSIINADGENARKAALRMAFKMTDTDAAGNITKDTLTGFLRRPFPALTDAQIEKIFLDADADKDGVIGCDDFVAYAETHPEFTHMMKKSFF